MGKWLLGRGPPTHRLKATDTEVSFNGNHRRVVEIKGGSLPWIDFKRYEVNMRIVVAVVGDEPVDAANYNLNNLSVRKSEREREGERLRQWATVYLFALCVGGDGGAL